MEKDHTPAKCQANRTVFRFTQAEAIEALANWLDRRGEEVPQGKMSVWFPSSDHIKGFEIALEVHHYDQSPPAESETAT